jgi:septal ring factor EnvC (AmiA/AmiB activator)
MHDSVELLRIMFDQMATKFYKAVVLDGSDLLNHHKNIFSASSVSELDVNRMSVTLRGAKRSFKGVEDNMIGLQSEVHYLIESVRSRIHELKDEIKSFEDKQKSMEQEIAMMETEIQESDSSAREYDRYAIDMDFLARKKKREAEEAAKWGIGELAAAGAVAVGIFAGGLPLLAAIPGVVLGGAGLKNVNDHMYYDEQAANYRHDAYRYWIRANGLRENVKMIKRNISNLKLEAIHVRHELQQLEYALRRVNDLSNSLHGSVKGTYEVVSMLQNMEIAIANAELDTQSIIERFKYIPNVIKRASDSMLKNTKSAWISIQELLKLKQNLLT